MRKLFSLVGIAVMILVQGCNIEEVQDEPIISNDSPIKVILSNEISQFPATKAVTQGFAAGDEVGIYLVNYKNGVPGTLAIKGNQADNVSFTLDENGFWNSAYDIYYKDSDTHVDFYGYYPYADPTDIKEYFFEIAQDQSKPAEHGQMAAYEASDFLWAKSEDVTPTESKVVLTFRHTMAGVRVRLNQGEGWESAQEFASVSKSVLVTNTTRKSTIDLSTGVVTVFNEPAPLTGIIPLEDDGEYRAIVVPQTVSTGKRVLTITIDGYPREIIAPSDAVYIPGKITTYNLDISKKIQTGEYIVALSDIAITDWQADNKSHGEYANEYVVVHNQNPGSLSTTIEELKMNPARIKNLKLTGKLSKEDYYYMRDQMVDLQRLNLKAVESLINDVYSIPSQAFYNKTSLKKCILPDKLQRIEDNAFSNTGLTGPLVLPEGLEYVTGFSKTGITDIFFPTSLKEIGSNAFSECSSLMGELIFPEELEIIGTYAFNWSAVSKIVLPESLTAIEYGAFEYCRKLSGSLRIPSKVTKIGNQAFSDCAFDGILTLPEGLKHIGSYAFRYSNFKGELILPSGLSSIGEYAFEGNEFTGTLKLPMELVNLGRDAFNDCYGITGVLELPMNMESVPENTFNNTSIEEVVLPKKMSAIGENAFKTKDNSLKNVICNAPKPPKVSGNPFSSGAVLEVPEDAMQLYNNSWSGFGFNTIIAVKNFSINSKLYRALNESHTRRFTMTVPNDKTWEVDSTPDWVSVNIITDTEVEISVAELEDSAPHREGEVIFKLIDTQKDVTTSLKVEQFNSTYSEGDIIKLRDASIGNGVNVVLIADGFDAKDISEGKYIAALNQANDYFFDIEPYSSYKNYFNVYGIVGISDYSGVSSESTAGSLRYGSKYVLNEGIVPDFNSVFSAVNQIPDIEINETLIILIENCTEYSGQCFMWKDGSAIAVVPMSNQAAPYDFRGFIHHEAGGHGFAKLADEMVYHNSYISNCKCSCCEHEEHIKLMKLYGFYENISLTGNMSHVPWKHLINDEQYSSVVDVYEGAFYHAYGVYKSEPISCMSSYIDYYNVISREQIVKRIMKYAGLQYSFEDFKTVDTGVETRTMTRSDCRYSDISERYDMHSPTLVGDSPTFN